ncbi:hypothetical protein F4808DRAFT_470644 [Astrocystis sublimbata]|nr:hypothetical protein F4808DRAFT_470644 [Astrocystis sublimbata]
MPHLTVPDYDDLPPVEGMPHGCAWGIFDRGGKKDTLGCLNFLDPSTVREAYKELTEGTSVSMNWPLDAISKPGFARKAVVHKVIRGEEQLGGVRGFDDELEFNTQASSQWDSLVHFKHQETGCGYNGNVSTKEDFERPSRELNNSELPTLEQWHGRGGLVGRGVLLDYLAYSEAKGAKYGCFSDKRISIEELEDVARFQGTEFKQGDILIIRTGFTAELDAASADFQGDLLSTGTYVGLEGSEKTARWFWNKRFSAVASDAIALETMPPLKEDGTPGNITDMRHTALHQYLLSFFGMHIGELWDLEALSEKCKALGRYSFVLTSVPLNVSGSIASPPNALALF